MNGKGKISRNHIEFEFNVQGSSSVSMGIFESHTLAAIQNFTNIEIQLSNVWIVTLCERIISTKNEQVMNRDRKRYSLKGYEELQRNSSEAYEIPWKYI